MLEFSLGSHLGWYLSSISHHHQSSKSKISKIHVFGHKRHLRHRHKLPLCRSGLEIFFKNAPIPTPGVSNESSVQSRLRMPHFQTSGKDFSAPKIQFEIQILLNQCNDRSIPGKKWKFCLSISDF